MPRLVRELPVLRSVGSDRMHADIAIASTGRYLLANARVHALADARLRAAFDARRLRAGRHRGRRRQDRRHCRARPDRPAPPRAIDLAGRIVLPAFVDCHTHIDKGHIWPRKPNPDGSFMGALDAAGEDRAARWNAARRRAAHGFLAALRLRARHQGDPHPSRFASRRRRRSPGRCSRRCGSAGAAASSCRRRACSASTAPAISRWLEGWRSASPRRAACSAPSPTWCPTSRNCSTACSRMPIELGLDLDFHADETDDVAAISLKQIAEAALRHKFEGKILVGHCCSLARQPDDEVARHAGQGGASRARRGVAADVQPLSAGPPARRHDAALARRHAAARDEGAGHPGRRRLRQYARPVLRLWRSRHARSLPHGDAHPAFRPSRSPTGRARSPRHPPTSCGYMAPEHWRPAGRPISSSSAGAAGRNCCRGRNRTGSWCATAGRSSGSFPTMPSSTSSDGVN